MSVLGHLILPKTQIHFKGVDDHQRWILLELGARSSTGFSLRGR